MLSRQIISWKKYKKLTGSYFWEDYVACWCLRVFNIYKYIVICFTQNFKIFCNSLPYLSLRKKKKVCACVCVFACSRVHSCELEHGLVSQYFFSIYIAVYIYVVFLHSRRTAHGPSYYVMRDKILNRQKRNVDQQNSEIVTALMPIIDLSSFTYTSSFLLSS